MYPGNLQINVTTSSMKTVYDLSCDPLTCHYLAYLIVTSPNLCRHMAGMLQEERPFIKNFSLPLSRTSYWHYTHWERFLFVSHGSLIYNIEKKLKKMKSEGCPF